MDTNNMKIKSFKVKAFLEVTYTLMAEDKEYAIEMGKGFLLNKIDDRNVAYDELKGKIIK